jgi:carbonic anhydrase
VVVLGHSRCGVILATLEEIRQPKKSQSPNLKAIVDKVRPAVDEALRIAQGHSPEEIVRHAVRANVSASVNHLRHDSEVLARLIENDGLLVVGAKYSLETGEVEFFDSEASVTHSHQA